MLIDIAPTQVSGLHLAGQPSTVLLRVFALQSFTSDDGLRIIQPGTPNQGPFYKEVTCNVSGTTVTVPSLQLESQTDAFNPGEVGARYYAAFYLPDGGFIAPFQPLANFQVRHDYNPTTWPKVVSYNTAPYVPAGMYQTYTRGQIDGLFKLLPSTITGGGAVNTVFGRDGDVVALANDYDIPKITGLQSALDSKASISHTHDASVIVSGIIPPAFLGTGVDPAKFLRGDGTWATPPTGSGPGGGVNTVFGRVGPDILALAGDYDIPKITGLSAALAAKADLPHYHDGSAITAGVIAPARLGTGLSGGGTTQFLRGDGLWAPTSSIGSGPGSVDTSATYTWTGAHTFKSISGVPLVVQAPAGKEIFGTGGDDGVSVLNWASMRLVQGTAARITFDPDGTTNNRRELRLDATGTRVRGPLLFEVSTDGSTFVSYGGATFTGGNTSLDITATAAGSQSAGFTIGTLPVVSQVYAAALFNTQSIIGDLVTSLPGKRWGFAFNAIDRYSVMIDNDNGDTVANTPLWLRQNGQLRRVKSDASKVLSFGIAGSPDATTFLRGDGSWATPAGTGPGGAVSSVSLAVDPTIFVSPVPGSPITSSGTLTLNLASQAAHKFLASPAGGVGVPTFRDFVIADLPALDASMIQSGIMATARLGTGMTTPDPTKFLRGDSVWAVPPGSTPGVTSVGLSLPSSVFILTTTGTPAGNPITGTGTFSVTLQTQPALQVFASPTATSGPPSFRILTPADIPNLDASKITTGTFAPARLGTGPTINSSYFLQGDGTWQLKSSLGGPGAVSGPTATIAAFDAAGQLVSALGAAPADYDVGTDAGPGTTIGNIHFKRRGLMLDSGLAVNIKYTTGNTCNVVYVQDGGSADPTGAGLCLLGPPNAAGGLTTGVRLIHRCGTGSPGDGSGKGDLLTDGRSSGSDLLAPNSTTAGMTFKGWLNINWWSLTTGKPFAPTAPLTIGRNDNGSEFIHLRQRGSTVGIPVRLVATGPTASPTTLDRTIFAIDGSFAISSNDATRTSMLEFWLVKNGADIPQMQLKPSTGTSSSGLWLCRSDGSTISEVQYSDPGVLGFGWESFRALVISA